VTRMRLLTALGPALLALTPSTAIAAGQTYTVVQCHPLNRDHASAVLEDASPYAARAFCGDPHNDYAVKVSSIGRARYGSFGRVRWPVASPALGIVAVDVRAKLRRDNSHAPRLWMADSQLNEVARVATGDAGPTGYRQYRWHAGGHGLRQLVAGLSCQRSVGCRQSTSAKTWVRDVRMEVADYSNPDLTTASAGLVRSGWIRGAQRVHSGSTDQGSGLRTLAISVNGVGISSIRGVCNAVPGTGYANRFKACGELLTLDAEADTVESPFRDGTNSVVVCATDFAGNRVCDQYRARVDNTAPSIAFSSSQDVSDPETIRAHIEDATSGIRSGQIFYRRVGAASWRPVPTRRLPGELQARINSTLDPPGDYEFMAEAQDVAGNSTQTTTRSNGEPMILTFPLKSRARLSAHLLPGGGRLLTVKYGEGAKVGGLLRDAVGRPLANQEVTITEYFGAGALIDRRVRTLRTDRDGLWGERLRPGPSRMITANYGGTRRYLADRATAGRLRVRSKASFHMSRRRVPEGRRVTFRGRVAHLAARIPPGGKLIELQVKDGSHWHSVRHAFSTRPNGRYRMRYRFARFYTSNVSYRFRVEVLREAGWPYEAPVTSRPKRLVVKAR
jgi:hypothetical protein